MATKRQREHKERTWAKHNERWFYKSANRIDRLNHISKCSLGLPRNYRLKAIRKLKERYLEGDERC